MERESTDNILSSLDHLQSRGDAIDAALRRLETEAASEMRARALSAEDQLERELAEEGALRVYYAGCMSSSSDYSDADDVDPAQVAATASGSAEAAAAVRRRQEEDKWRVEAVLARRTRKGVLYYQVKWAHHNAITWERDVDIENRVAVDAFETLRARLSHIESPAQPRRPVYYVSAGRRRREERRLRAAALAGVDVQQLVAAASPSTVSDRLLSRRALAPGATAVWSCEVEPHIWIPYEAPVAATVERAFQAGAASAAVKIAGRNYTVTLNRDGQYFQEGGAPRRVQRVVIPPLAQVRQDIERMSLQELRDFISTTQMEMPPEALHEALSRLHDLERVPTGVAHDVLAKFPRTTFGTILEQIANGVDYQGFASECVICLEDYDGDSQLLCLPDCGHLFHVGCITEYLSKFSRHCPFCKQDV